MKIPFITDYFEYTKSNKEFEKAAKEYVNGSYGFMDLMGAATGYSGDKFCKGFGITKDFRVVNLKLLQYRSIQLIRENLYANALFTRLETKVINKGLTLNAAPMLEILGPQFGITDKQLRVWSRLVEARFMAWSRDKKYISWNKEFDFSKIQKFTFWTAMLSGDCLQIITLNKRGLPVIKLVDGFYVSTPFDSTNNKIIDGVELDNDGREIAYHVENGLNGHIRVKAYARGGRRRAWLVKGSQQRINDVRGMPRIAIGMQNLNEAGKYLDSEQRAALVNSYVAMSRNRDETQGPAAGGHRKRAVLGQETKETKTAGPVKFEQQQPGVFLTNLAPNEKITSFDTKRPNVNFAGFMEAVLKPIAYSNEIPPEIFFLEYGNNFSASRQANLDFKDAVDKMAHAFSRQCNDPIYTEWLTGEVINGSITSPGYIFSLNQPGKYDVRNGWQNAIWRGLPSTSVDLKKMIQALEIVEKKGWLTNDIIASQYFSTDWYDNMRRKKTENELKADADEPLNENNGNNSNNTDKDINSKFENISLKMGEMQATIEDLEERLDDSSENKEN